MTDPTEAILQARTTVADKIRALAKTGHSRAKIASLLGKSYQHVRNVLVDDERRERQEPSPATGVAETAAPYQPRTMTKRSFRIDVEGEGKLQLPAQIQAALGVAGGGYLMARIEENGEVVLVNGPISFQRLVEDLRTRLDPNVSLVDELIAERRAEAAAEDVEIEKYDKRG